MVEYPTQHDDFLMWVGFCITAWARTEERLFKICETCLQARKDRVAVVYYRTPTIDARIKLIDELVRTVLPKSQKKNGGHDHPDLVEWNRLRKDMVDLLGARSRIAHHPVRAQSARGQNRAFWYLEKSSWFEIYASDAERLRTGRDDAKPLKQDDLVSHCHMVHEITRRAAKFSKDVLPKHVG